MRGQRFGIDRHEHASPAIFRCILDEIAKNFVEILPLHRSDRVLVAVKIEARALVDARHRAQHAFHARPNLGTRMSACAPPHRTRAGEVVFDMALHRLGLATDEVGQLGIVGGRGIGQHGERRLQRMGEIAGMGARFFGLTLGMRKQGVDLLDQRLDFQRERLVDPVGTRAAHILDRRPHPAQRAEADPVLKNCEREQSQSEQGKAPDEDRTDAGDLVVQLLPRGGDREGPARVAVGKDDSTLGDTQRLVRELLAVVETRIEIVGIAPDFQRVVPQRSRRIAFLPRRADLIIQPAIGFEKARLPQNAVEIDLAIEVDFGRHDHGVQQIFELVVEIALDQIGERPVQRKATCQQQDGDPPRRDRHHAAREAAFDLRALGARLLRRYRTGTARVDRRSRHRPGVRRVAGRRDRRASSQGRGSW